MGADKKQKKVKGVTKKAEIKDGKKKALELRQKVMSRRHKDKRKIYRTTKFRRRPTKKIISKPKCAQRMPNEILNHMRHGKYDILRHPIATDAITKKIENENTITFVVDRKASKKDIKKAFESLEEVKVLKVRTLINPLGEKKAFIKLGPEENAMDVATKLNIC